MSLPDPLMTRCALLLLLLLSALASTPAMAADPCPLLRAQTQAADTATRIAAVACEEHQLWRQPLIDRDGRLAGSTVREAEAALLANGEPAWRRVAGYWRDSGQLVAATGRPGAGECAYAATTSGGSPGCRAFIVDTPWSAAFVSWVMQRARLPGFRGSPSHVSYVRSAYRDPQGSAYRVADPRAVRPAAGDLLCYVRAPGRVFGFAGLAALLAGSDDGLGMHCDVVAAVDPQRDRTAYLIGGNVLDGVTMRLLPLTAGGQFQGLPQRALGDTACSPDAPSACDANRQDWAVLLQLRPATELATLAPPPPLRQDAAVPAAAPGCCVICIVGAGVPRCPTPTPGGGAPVR